MMARKTAAQENLTTSLQASVAQTGHHLAIQTIIDTTEKKAIETRETITAAPIERISDAFLKQRHGNLRCTAGLSITDVRRGEGVIAMRGVMRGRDGAGVRVNSFKEYSNTRS